MENFTLEDVKFDFTSPYFITKLANPIAISLTALYYRLYAVFIMHRKLPKIMDDLQKIDALLKLPQHHHKNDAKRLIFYVVAIVLVIPLQIVAVWDTADGFNPYMAFFLLDLVNNYALECNEFLFISLCYLIESRYGYINKKLTQQQLFKQSPPSVKSICQTIDTFTIQNSTPPTTTVDDFFLANDIQTYRLAFQKLLRLASMLNNQFDVRLLVALGVCTFNVLINLYTGLFGGGYRGRAVGVGGLLKALLWAGYYFARLIWICVACEFLCKQVKIFLNETMRHKNMITSRQITSKRVYVGF